MLILEMLITKVDAARSSRPHYLEENIYNLHRSIALDDNTQMYRVFFLTGTPLKVLSASSDTLTFFYTCDF